MYEYNCQVGREAMYKVGVKNQTTYISLRNLSVTVGLPDKTGATSEDR